MLSSQKPGQVEVLKLAESDPGTAERRKLPNKVCILRHPVLKLLINERVM